MHSEIEWREKEDADGALLLHGILGTWELAGLIRREDRTPEKIERARRAIEAQLRTAELTGLSAAARGQQ